MLKKEFKYAPAGDADKSKVDEDGISDAQADFSWERDVKPQVCHPLASSSINDVNQSSQATKIDWKDPENAFTKKYPRQVSEDEDADDMIAINNVDADSNSSDSDSDDSNEE